MGLEPVACVVCGVATPREEMFGAAPDLRCPGCAEALRSRVHPVRVRSGAGVFRPSSAQPEPRATGALLGLLVVVFFATKIEALRGPFLELLFEAPAVLEAGALRWVHHPHPWQPALWCVTHFQIWHLAMNGLALWQLGRWFEWGWGAKGLLFVALGAGMAGTASAWLVQGEPAIGLSGGIFGLEAWLLALRRHHVLAGAMVNRVFLHSLIAGNVLLILLTELGGMRISHVGHGAGFLWGYLAGVAARSRAPRAGLCLVLLSTLALLLLPTFVAPLGWRMTLLQR